MNASIAAQSGFAPALLESDVTNFVIDSRQVKAGAVFFALSQPDYKNNAFNGDFEDSHKYVPAAFENGALACVVRPDRFEEHREILAQFQDRLLFVDDAVLALQNLAKGVYEEWNKPVVAITGSAGKTTAKELTNHVLQSKGFRVLSNIKNYNNGIGHPLTVLRLLSEGMDFDLAVLEMGMSTPMNEIARLCRITPPDVPVELNVLPVHIEHLGTIEGIQRAKAELVEGMKPGGTAVLNADDFRVMEMSRLSKGKTLTYGIENPADVSAANIRSVRFGETHFSLNTPDGSSAEVEMMLSGKHSVLNALAAAAAGFCFGMKASEIAAALKTIAPPAQRGEVLHFADGFTVINDSYNSNPAALFSMVSTLIENGQNAKRKIVVAGEMLELGEDEARIHTETGERLGKSGIDVLYGVRNLAKNLIEGARHSGLSRVAFFNDSNEAGESLANEIQAGDLVLVKGSRGVKTEKVVEKLLEKFELENKA